MRRFGGDRVKGIMEWAGMGDDVPIENRVVSKALEASQSKVEGYHFEVRKHLVEYDDVANQHRERHLLRRRRQDSGRRRPEGQHTGDGAQ